MSFDTQPALAIDKPMQRDQVLTLINTAIATGELRYARRLCSSWLTNFPGDMQVNLLYARAYMLDKSPSINQQAGPILEQLCAADPEFTDAQAFLAEAEQLAGSPKFLVAKACANALTHGRSVKTTSSQSVSSWAKYIHEARTALGNARAGDHQQIEKAEYFVHKALVENPDTPLAAVTHLQLVESQEAMPRQAVRNLAQIYHERWPDCLQFTLILAKEMMAAGEFSQSVSMLHQAVSQDITGQVARKLWGDQHEFSSMWPANIEAANTGPNSPQNLPVPAGVASSLGWNAIAAVSTDRDDPDYVGENFNSETTEEPSFDFTAAIPLYASHALLDDEPAKLSESSKTVQNELEKMANELNRPHIAHEDSRFPIYIIFTTHGGLTSQYHSAGATVIDSQLKKLAQVVHGRKINHEYWGSLLFYADDPTCTQAYNLHPAPFQDAWQLKVVLSGLDAALEKRGERIGAVLIVGGPEIVPFHNLPNPVEDADSEVPSDNPYSAKDNNYFISDWPVGRVSAGSGSDPTSLLSLLNVIANRYDKYAKQPGWFSRFLQRIRELIKTGLTKKLSSFGYTAAVWKRASLSVFRPIGNPDDLLISPPIHASDPFVKFQAENLKAINNKRNNNLLMPETQLAYFNLHGVPDSSEWYGQVDPVKPEDGPEFPVAMRPQDIRNSGSAPKLVFSEACYGANILGKSIDEAISLKFLASGTQAMVGSTCISYGALSTPLSAADLLGRVFWSLLQEGFSAGESLRRAKIHLTREMNQRQGYLDAEDQKTLISFVLFGDPLAQPFQTKVTPKVTPHLSDAAVPVATVCERTCNGEAGSSVPLETISHLKSVVSQYLPGMGDAEVVVSHQHQQCSKGKCGCGKQCQFSKLARKNQAAGQPRRRVVTLSKQFVRADRKHMQYARLTLDDQGKIIKMVVSH